MNYLIGLCCQGRALRSRRVTERENLEDSENTWTGGKAGCRVIQTTAALQVSDMRTEEKHLDWQLKYCWF